MDDFSYPGLVNVYGVPPSENNMVGPALPPTTTTHSQVAPGKRPVSSMSPSVVVDREGRVVAVVGASGGTKITTAVAQVPGALQPSSLPDQVLYRVLYLGQGVKEAVDARRLHHQLFPDQVQRQGDLMFPLR